MPVRIFRREKFHDSFRPTSWILGFPTTILYLCPISTRQMVYTAHKLALEISPTFRWLASSGGTAAVGYERTYSRPKSRSALPPKADILVAVTDFRC